MEQCELMSVMDARDVETVASFLHQLTEREVGREVSFALVRSQVERGLRDPRYVCLVARDANGRTCGCVFAWRVTEDALIWEVGSLYVAMTAPKETAIWLMYKIVQAARDRGAKTLLMTQRNGVGIHAGLIRNLGFSLHSVAVDPDGNLDVYEAGITTVFDACWRRVMRALGHTRGECRAILQSIESDAKALIASER